MENIFNRLGLGTAQFGLDYGIANTSGKIKEKEASKILNFAENQGIKLLDTAKSYGKSERIIGKFLEIKKKKFKIVSKFPSLEKYSEKEIKDVFHKSLSNLKIGRIYGYLIHKFDDFIHHDSLWKALQDLKEEGVVQEIGFSIYRPEELEIILNRRIKFDLIQLPYSIFDRRFEKYFQDLKRDKIEIHTRSVFLQGLAFLEPASLKGPLKAAKTSLELLRKISQKWDIAINALCVNFPLLNQFVDKVIIGVDSLAHLRKNIEDLNLIKRIKDVNNSLDDLSIESEDVLLPYNWSKQ